jgi:hypothetical protein
LRGEKVPKADEGSGAIGGHEVLAAWFARLLIGNVIARVKSPLIRLRHLLPHKKAVGEKALDWRS